MNDRYKIIGPAYDFLSSIYAGDSILECKKAMLNLEHLEKGAKVWFVGAGHGKDAIHAAELGMNVTVIELSETMVKKFREGVEALSTPVKINTVQGDILKCDEFGQYDMVVANFFLNVFDRAFMLQLLDHMLELTKPGGKFVVGDFELPSGSFLKRNFQRAYWYTAVTGFNIIAKNAIHPIYDYPEILSGRGLVIKDTRHYSLLSMNIFWSIMAEKPLEKTGKAA